MAGSGAVARVQSAHSASTSSSFFGAEKDGPGARENQEQQMAFIVSLLRFSLAGRLLVFSTRCGQRLRRSENDDPPGDPPLSETAASPAAGGRTLLGSLCARAHAAQEAAFEGRSVGRWVGSFRQP